VGAALMVRTDVLNAQPVIFRVPLKRHVGRCSSRQYHFQLIKTLFMNQATRSQKAIPTQVLISVNITHFEGDSFS
jgi:hypothetical protein